MFQARHARASGRHHDEAWHLLKAGHWNESHHCLLTNVASDAIINGISIIFIAVPNLLYFVYIFRVYQKVLT